MNWVAIVEVMAEEDYMTRTVAVTLFWEKVAVCGNSTLNSTLMTWRIWLKIIFVQIIEFLFCNSLTKIQSALTREGRGGGCLNKLIVFQAHHRQIILTNSHHNSDS